MKLNEFISKWSAWWMLSENREALNSEFRKELQQLKQPEVKPLEWSICGGGWISHPLGLYYHIWQSAFGDENWRLRIGQHGSVMHFPTESEAKEFAQADFDSKVLGMIAQA